MKSVSIKTLFLVLTLMLLPSQQALAINNGTKIVCAALLSLGATVGTVAYDAHQREVPFQELIVTHRQMADYDASRKPLGYQFLAGPAMALGGRIALGAEGAPLVDIVKGWAPPSTALLPVIDDVLIYSLIVFGLRGIKRTFFAMSLETYLRKSENLLSPDAGKILFIDATGASQVFAGYPLATFERLHGGNLNAVYVDFNSLDQLKSKLERLADDAPFDRIVLFMDGKPGQFTPMKPKVTGAGQEPGAPITIEQIADVVSDLGFLLAKGKRQELLPDSNDLDPEVLTRLESDEAVQPEDLKKLGLAIYKKLSESEASADDEKTELWVVGSSILNGEKNDLYGDQVRRVARAFLPAGGRIIGATKKLEPYEYVSDPKAFQKGKASGADTRALIAMYLFGFDNIRSVSAIVPHIWGRNYADALRNDAVVIAVTPGGDLRRERRERFQFLGGGQ